MQMNTPNLPRPLPRPPQKSYTTIIIAIIVLLVVLVVGGGILYYMSNPPADTKSPTTTDEDEKPDFIFPTADKNDNIQGDRYYLARQCPDYLTNKGYYGVLLKNSDYIRNPFNNGGGYNEHWTWTHPYVCYGTANSSDLPKLYNFTNKPTGLQSGIIMRNDVYGASPFAGGIPYNSAWTWAHPYLQTADKPDGYYLNEQGTMQTGLIINNNSTGITPFAGGIDYCCDGLWKWRHPYITK
jgi:hypothetical protein